MDQGTKEETVRTRADEVKERYEKLIAAYRHDEQLLGELVFQMDMQGKKADKLAASAPATLHLFEINEKRTRLILEWVKLAFEEHEDRTEHVFSRLTDFLEAYEPMLKDIKAERAKHLISG